MKFLLSVIAVCLVMITSKLYIPEAHAEVGGMDTWILRHDDDFKEAVKYVVEYNCYTEAQGVIMKCDRQTKYGN